MQAMTSTELVATILEMVPDLQHAEPEAKMRLSLMARDNYLHAGYYHQDVNEMEVTINNANGEMPDFHLENLVDHITDNNQSGRDASGYYFILHGEGHNKFQYCHYYVTAK